MVAILEVDVAASDTALAETFASLPEVRFELEKIVAGQSDRTWPYVWILGPSRTEIAEALRSDPTVSDFIYLTGDENAFLYDINVTEKAQELVETIQEANGTVLSAVGTDGSWSLDLRFGTREVASQAYDQLNESGMSPTINRIVEFPGDRGRKSGLTEEQREAFAYALEFGYFKVPRKISLEELAAEVDISHQAMSERIRRGCETLIDAEFKTGEESHYISRE